MKHVYVAIPVEVFEPQVAEARHGRDARDHEPTRVAKESGDGGRWHRHQVACFGAGSLLGIGFSVLGFRVQETFHFASIFGYSLAWSCFTSIASYGIFTALLSCLPSSSSLPNANASTSQDRRVRSMEYSFALGVFLGFCAACTVTDVLLGMPLKNILLTVTVAAAWALVMAYFGGANNESEDDNECFDGGDELVRVVVPQKGTRLPLVIV
jgi:hypothetical protein